MSTKELEDFTIKVEEIAYDVQDILVEYNFVGIFERLHESLVLMSMLTGMNINDVIIRKDGLNKSAAQINPIIFPGILLLECWSFLLFFII